MAEASIPLTNMSGKQGKKLPVDLEAGLDHDRNVSDPLYPFHLVFPSIHVPSVGIHAPMGANYRGLEWIDSIWLA